MAIFIEDDCTISGIIIELNPFELMNSASNLMGQDLEMKKTLSYDFQEVFARVDVVSTCSEA